MHSSMRLDKRQDDLFNSVQFYMTYTCRLNLHQQLNTVQQRNKREKCNKIGSKLESSKQQRLIQWMTSYNKVQLQTELRISDHIYRYLVILKIKLCSNTNPIHQEVLEDCCLHHLPPEINQKSLHKQEIQSHSNHNFPLYNSTVSYI